jgi:DNA-binding transcriptional LysR family regulator
MKSTLEQWRMFKAVVDHGGYAQASAAIHKSQSTISYGVHKLQQQLGVQLLEVEGRKALLTHHGRTLLQRAEQLLNQADSLDQVASSLSQGIEPLVRLAVDTVYPAETLFDAFELFSQRFPDTRIELDEFVLNGGNERLLEGETDLLITSSVPPGYHGQLIHRARFLPVAAPGHPLLTLGRPVTFEDLPAQRQIVLRDSGRHRSASGGWLGAHQRWTVSHTSTRLAIIRRGLGFAWMPEHLVASDLNAGTLMKIPFADDAHRYVDLHLVSAHGGNAGPATQALAQLLKRDSGQS